MPVENKDGQAVYVSPQEDYLYDESNKIIAHFRKYAKVHNLSREEVWIQKAVFPRIPLRVDKRIDYFLVFHDMTHINEIKQAALVAYWILKFRPFMVISQDPERVHMYARINEGFALFYMLSIFARCAEKQGKSLGRPSQRLISEWRYAFTYWDLSKEALILIAETIGEALYGVEAQGMPDEDANE